MNELYIIGDSSAKYLADPFSENDYFHDIQIDDISIHIRGFRSKSAYQVDRELLDSIDFKEDSVVLFYFGMVDIRSFSARYKNIEKVALKYVNTIKEYFKGKNIIFGFIEPPLTAHIDDWLSIFPELGNWISGSVEERIIAHKKFINIISLDNLYIPIVGPILDSYYLDSTLTDDFNHYNIEINNLILDHILLTVNNL
jgi:hypothetical protein